MIGQHLARDVAGALRAGEEDIGRRDLLGLGGPLITVSAPNLETSFACLSAGLSGVQTGPGATALTRMPRGARCVARLRVKA